MLDSEKDLEVLHLDSLWDLLIKPPLILTTILCQVSLLILNNQVITTVLRRHLAHSEMLEMLEILEIKIRQTSSVEDSLLPNNKFLILKLHLVSAIIKTPNLNPASRLLE